MFLSLYFFGCLLLFSAGLAAFFATVQVYFRDTSSFLPYFVRIWMYLSPVLWLPENVAHFSKTILTVVRLNPMYSMLGGYAETIQEQKVPDAAPLRQLRALGRRRRRDRVRVLHLAGA